MGLGELPESIKWHDRHTGGVKFVNTLTRPKDGRFSELAQSILNGSLLSKSM